MRNAQYQYNNNPNQGFYEQSNDGFIANDMNYYPYQQYQQSQQVPQQVPQVPQPVQPVQLQLPIQPQPPPSFQTYQSQPAMFTPQNYSQPMFHPGPPVPEQTFEKNNFQFPMPNDFVTDTALKYGSDMVEQGSEYIQRNLERYVPTSTMKYYFEVDNMYVAKKLLLILFPFFQKDWSIQYNPDKQPVPPRCDKNAPDLYIPTMALLTYVLNCGFMFGIGNRFSPDQLGAMASTAIGFLLAEILILMLTLYIVNATTSLRYMDMVAYSGYKFVGMNIVLLLSLAFESKGYLFSLVYFSISLDYFLLRTLNMKVFPHNVSSVSEGNKRRIYLLLVTAIIQPLIMWLLTRSVVA